MPIVTKIEEFNKNRYKIFLDNEFAFVLYKGELRVYGIREDVDLQQDIIQEITQVVLLKRAKLRLLNLLGKKEYTRRELIQKLEEGLYSEHLINSALEYVESYGYVNDVVYARRYIEWKCSTKSRREIEQKLCLKGISKEDMNLAFEELGDHYLKESTREAIRKELRKKNFHAETATYEQRQKALAFLYRKGYSQEQIREVMEDNT